ncbi:MAG: glucans biosynthesis glucosyltransferase MdoH, partial [Alphaproteobacteria bacterium]
QTDIAAAEEAAWAKLVGAQGGEGRIFYRRRPQNTGRKAGNIADFVRRWGAAYAHMIVLDADSVMRGDTMVALARMMQANPRVGIIQTLPMAAGRTTLFARATQFAARLNGPMLAAGLAFWQLGEGNYWGHNAIIRMRPFAAFCGLPTLPGAAPLGGDILSHDFVEAAFMRRAGYEVWMAPALEGSWEEIPSNALDMAARDKRWCQGNMQHMALLPCSGLHWVSRIHMLTGVMSYAASLFWLAALFVSSAIIGIEAIEGHAYFLPGYQLFPNWPQARDSEIALLLGGTLALLFVPKFLGLALALRNAALRRQFGGASRLLASVLCEQALSVLMAPMMMVFHAGFVAATLAGRVVAWNAQDRSDRGVGLGEAYRRLRPQLWLGLAWTLATVAIAPRFFWWLSPVLAGLLLAIPLAMATSRADWGLRARAWGLFLTPEETAPPLEWREVLQSTVPAVPAPARLSA